jgi:glycopeptide antibiotics resistance protein
MKESHKREKRFNFKQYQNAKKSRRMLVRFIIYSIVIGVLVYLILAKDFSSKENSENKDVEFFEIEVEQN